MRPDELARCVAVLAHGAGSTGDFVSRAFPAARLGLKRVVTVEDRTGRVSTIAAQIRRAVAQQAEPVIVGGVSLGGHAAGSVLADPPGTVIGGLIVLPAWTGRPDHVAAMTGAAAEAVGVLGTTGVLADLPADDWVTSELARAWGRRSSAGLHRELRAAAEQPAPTGDVLSLIARPVGLVAMTSDPLHPASVAARWARAMAASAVRTMGRDAPAQDLATFADHGRQALLAAGHAPDYSSSDSAAS